MKRFEEEMPLDGRRLLLPVPVLHTRTVECRKINGTRVPIAGIRKAQTFAAPAASISASGISLPRRYRLRITGSPQASALMKAVDNARFEYFSPAKRVCMHSTR